VEAQRLDRPDDLFGRFVEVRDENDDSAPPQELLKMVQRLGEIRSGARFRLLESAQQADQLPLPRRRTYVRANFIVKDDQARRVALVLNRQIEQRRRGEPGVVHFIYGMGRELHGIAGIEQYGEHAVRLAAIALQVSALRARNTFQSTWRRSSPGE